MFILVMMLINDSGLLEKISVEAGAHFIKIWKKNPNVCFSSSLWFLLSILWFLWSPKTLYSKKYCDSIKVYIITIDSSDDKQIIGNTTWSLCVRYSTKDFPWFISLNFYLIITHSASIYIYGFFSFYMW